MRSQTNTRRWSGNPTPTPRTATSTLAASVFWVPMNLAIRGIDANIAWADSFLSDSHKDLKADFVLTNPPFNAEDWGLSKIKDDVRWAFGAPPAGGMRKQKDGSTLHVDGRNANYAWIQYFVHHLNPKGVAGFVLANEAMSGNTSGEGEIRRWLIEADLVDCMVALPGQLLYTTQIPACLWFLTRSKTADDKRGFCKSATLKDIESHDFVLTPDRYVGAARPASDLDLVTFASAGRQEAISRLREAFDESCLPFRVDLFVWDEAPKGFRGNIEEARVAVQKEKKGCKLPEGWQETTLGEFCPFSYGKSLPKKLKDNSGEVPVFGSNGVVGHHAKSLIQDRGIIIGRKGTVGTVIFSSVPFWLIDTTFYIPEDSHRDLRYTFYPLKSLRMEHMNADSAVPGLNRNAAHVRKITIPPLPEQKSHRPHSRLARRQDRAQPPDERNP